MKEAELTREWGWRSDQTVKTYIKQSKRQVEEKLRHVHTYFQNEASKFYAEVEKQAD